MGMAVDQDIVIVAAQSLRHLARYAANECGALWAVDRPGKMSAMAEVVARQRKFIDRRYSAGTAEEAARSLTPAAG
jgi:hypothetical protein